MLLCDLIEADDLLFHHIDLPLKHLHVLLGSLIILLDILVLILRHLGLHPQLLIVAAPLVVFGMRFLDLVLKELLLFSQRVEFIRGVSHLLMQLHDFKLGLLQFNLHV